MGVETRLVSPLSNKPSIPISNECVYKCICLIKYKMNFGLQQLTATGGYDIAYANAHPDQPRRGNSYHEEELQGHTFPDGRLNTHSMIVTHGCDQVIPKSIRIINPNDFQLNKIEIEVGGRSVF